MLADKVLVQPESVDQKKFLVTLFVVLVGCDPFQTNHIC